MPLGDGTGPAGFGPMTGRAAGYCAGFSVPGYMNPLGDRFGGAFGRGRGRGWGYAAPYRFMPWAPPAAYPPAIPAYGAGVYGPAYTADQEREFLQNHVKVLENQLETVKKRLSEIEEEIEKKKED